MYNYEEAIKADIRQYIEDNGTWLGLDELNRDELFETLYNNLETADRVTGKNSGSYTSNNFESEENLEGNLSLIRDMCRELSIPAKTIGEKLLAADYNFFDVNIRCFLLGACIEMILEELENEGHFEKIEV